MSFPRLKNALLCKAVLYLIILGALIAPIVIIVCLGFIPTALKLVLCVGWVFLSLAYLIKNFLLLMTADIALTNLHLVSTARKSFVLRPSFSVEATERRLARFGKSCDTALFPAPSLLRYKVNMPITVYSSGIERVIMTYHVDFLDKATFRSFVNSAAAISESLKGKCKPLFVDKIQKNSPINRATVVFIFAKTVDDGFQKSLFDAVCQNGGDGLDTALLPCVIDLKTQTCTFDSLRLPNLFQKPAKNRGIKIVQKYIFNGDFTFAASGEMLEPIKELDANQSLWHFLKKTKKEIALDDKQTSEQFEKMTHKQIVCQEDCLYVKWKDRGVYYLFELNEELKTAELDSSDMWDYPTQAKISKDTIKELENLISLYFAKLGYTAKFISFDS